MVPRPIFLLGRRFGHGLTYVVIGLVRVLPARASYALGAGLGGLVWTLQPRWRRTAERNVQIFYKGEPLAADTPEAKRQRLAIGRAGARHLGWHVIEFIRMGYLPVPQSMAMVVEEEGLEHLRAAIAEGKGVVVFGLHYANWELPGEFLAQRFPPFYAVGKAQSDEFFTRLAFPWRTRLGIGNIVSGNKSNSTILKVLRAGGLLGLISDQNGGRRGIIVPFAGTPASTVPGAATLGLRTGAPLLLLHVRRIAPGRHKVICRPPLSKDGLDGFDPATGKFTDAALVEMLTRINAEIEAVIREDPTQWLWGHKRWKTRPPGEPSLYS